jgi:hypothetical protein
MRVIFVIISVVACLLTGCGRQERSPAPDPQLMKCLTDAFTAQGAKVATVDDWLVVDEGRLRTRAAYSNQTQYQQGLILQADFISILPSGERIVESVGGTGKDLNEALEDACGNFETSTFPALCSALLGRHSDDAKVIACDIAGVPRTVTFGSARARGDYPAGSWPPVFAAFQEQLKASKLPRGLHWGHLFCSHLPPDPPEVDVFLDNETWSEQQKEALQLPWPNSEKFYSVRVFFIVQDR